MTVNSIRDALGVKGCTLFLVNHKTKHLEVAASMGLSNEYLNKGPVSAVESIPSSLEGPVAISNVMDDPRIQYPEAAKKGSLPFYPYQWPPPAISSGCCGCIRISAGISP